MSVLGLNHINLRGNRDTLEQLKNFYIEVVGLTQGNRPPFKSFGYWLYANGRDIVHLTEAEKVEERVSDKKYTIDHFALSCSNIDCAIATLIQHGITYTKSEVPLSGQTQLFFNDPVGNGVELNFTNIRIS
jgi:glyoxylase I family protein